MIEKSIEANELKERCVAKELYWGKEGVENFQNDIKDDCTYDLILGTDLIYELGLFIPLLETIYQMSSSNTKTILVCTDHGSYN